MSKSVMRFIVIPIVLYSLTGCAAFKQLTGSRQKKIDPKILPLGPQAAEDMKLCTGYMLDIPEFENRKMKKFKNRNQALFALGKLKGATLITPSQKELAKRLLAEDAQVVRDANAAYLLAYTRSCNVTAVWNMVRILSKDPKKYKLKKKEIREVQQATLRYVDELSSYPNNWTRLTFGILMLEAVDQKLNSKKKNRYKKEIRAVKAELDRLKAGPLKDLENSGSTATATDIEMTALEETRACEPGREKLRSLYSKLAASS